MWAWRHRRSAAIGGCIALAAALGILIPVRAAAQTHAVETVVNIAHATGLDSNGQLVEGTGRAETPVQRVAQVGLSPGSEIEAPPGTWAEFSHTIANHGNYTETFRLVAQSGLGWEVELQPLQGGAVPDSVLDVGPLAPGDSAGVLLRVHVPPAAIAGQIDPTTLTAQAIRVPQESRAVIDRTRVAALALDPFLLEVDPTTPVPPGAVLTYRIAFGNPDTRAALAELVVEDSLVAGLGAVLDATSGRIADLRGGPAVVDVATQVDSIARRVTWRFSPLPPGFRGNLMLAVRVASDAAAGSQITNRVFAAAPSFGTAISNPVVTPVVPPYLELQLVAATPQIEPGDAVLLTLTAVNRSLVHALDSLVVAVRLPTGFRFQEGGDSVRRVDTASLAAGAKQSWTLAAAASERLGRGNHRAAAAGHATTLGGVTLAAQATADVETVRRLGHEATIVGRVYVDDDSSFAPGEFEGLPNVRLVLEDGMQCTTDARGRFHLEGVRPGLHVLRLDRSGLPAELAFEGEARGERRTGLTQFVELGPDAVVKVNFRARMRPDASRTRQEIAIGGETYRFDDFVLFEPGSAQLRPAAARLLAGLAPTEGGGDSLVAAWTAKPEIEAAAPPVPEPPLEMRIRSMSPEPQILEPSDGSVAVDERIAILVKLPFDAAPRLFVDDVPVSVALVGTRVEHPGGNVAVLQFIGVPLHPGENRIRLEAWNDSLLATATASVRRAGAPVQIELTIESAPADGVATPRVQARVVDEAGLPAVQVQFLTVEVEGGLERDDADPARDGFQVRLRDGQATIELPPAHNTEARRVQVACDGAEAVVAVRALPAPHDWVVTGLGQVALATRPGEQPLDDDEMQRGASAQAGVALEGRVGNGALTVGLDTRRDRDALFGTLENDRLFPALGDGTVPVASTPSRWPVFARWESAEGHAQVGDFRTGWNDFGLARYDQALTGFDAAWRTSGERVTVQAFAAAAPKETIREDLPGRGIAGPLVLRRRPLVVHAERLSIETRERLHSGRVLTSRVLVRDADYTIDYTNGVVYLAEPLLAADANWNPMFLVALYGAESDAPSAPAWGLRSQAQVLPGLQAGFVSVREEGGATGYGLVGGDVAWTVRPNLVLAGEVAHSAAARADGAVRLGLQQQFGPGRSVALEFRDVGEQFENPSGLAAGDIGTRNLRLQTRWNLEPGSRLSLDASSEQRRAGDSVRRVVATDWARDADRWSAGLGWRLTHDQDVAGTRLANVLVARGRRALGSRFGLETTYQQAVGEAVAAYPTRLGVGVDARLTELIGLTLRQEWDGSNTGRRATLLGLESRLDDRTAITTGYQIQSMASETQATASAGVRTAFPLGRGFSATAAAQHGRLTNESDRGTGSLSLGGAWNVPRHTAALQYELLSSSGLLQHGLRGETTARLGRDWTLLGRERWLHGRTGGVARSGHDLLLGWAYRPVASDEFHWLASVRFLQNAAPVVNPEVSTSRLVLSLQSHYEISPRWSLGSGIGVRRATATDPREHIVTSGILAHGRMTREITSHVDAALGLRVRTRNDSRADWSCGLESGVRIAKDLRAVLGYNFIGFADPDFAPREITAHTGYVALRVKFDERSLGMVRPND